MDKVTNNCSAFNNDSKSMIECLNDSFEIIYEHYETKKEIDNVDHFYCVINGDTIERVAAKFKMTPNNLMSMNKLHSRTLFINQKLKVKKPDENENNNLSGPCDRGKEASQKNIKYPTNNDSMSSTIMLKPLHCDENHLKVVSKYITDSEGIIKGKLLLTSVFFTFIPSISDPVIMEYGFENFTIHLPNNKIACVSMYNDSEMMAYKRSQRKDMINEIPEPTSQVNWVSMTSDTVLEDLSHNRDRAVTNYCLDDFLNRSNYVHHIANIIDAKFVDHKYLCVVASPRYRKIKAGHQKEDEYWFMVPTDKAQSLTDYFLTHSKTRYDIGADVDTISDWLSDEINPGNSSRSMVKQNSFAKVENLHEPVTKTKNKWNNILKTLRSKSIQWEIVNMDLELGLNFYEESEDVNSKVLCSKQIKELMKHLPALTIGATWELIYTTDRDGWSLSTMYRNVYNSTRGCCLLLIKDSNSMVFGAMCNSHIHMSSSFYGNGTTFIFRWHPDFEKFPFSKKNNFILFGDPNFFLIGSSNCNNAIRIEKSLFSGITQACETFDSPALVTSESFDVITLEVWSFY